MIENTTDSRVREAIENAHKERGRALNEFFGWLTGRH